MKFKELDINTTFKFNNSEKIYLKTSNYSYINEYGLEYYMLSNFNFHLYLETNVFILMKMKKF